MERVVVTGYGMVSPLGLSVQETWQNLLNGVSGVAPITHYDASEHDTQVAAEVKHFDAEVLLGRRFARRYDRKEHFANAAAAEAMSHSGVVVTDETCQRIGQSISSAFGGHESLTSEIEIMVRNGHRATNPMSVLKCMVTSPSVNMQFNLRGPSFTISSACASGSDGIGVAADLIRMGRADVMLAGGTDAVITPFFMSLLTRLRAQSRRSEGSPSPFSANRDGLIAGEGAGILVLESLSHALKRGAAILAEMVGYGATNDAFHATAPRENGAESARAIRLALAEGHINPEDVDYINAHGTGTVLNDSSETEAIKSALEDHAYRIPVSSTKSMTGHMMAAAGAVEAIFSILAIQHSVVPPTINLMEPDPACDLDYVPDEARDHPVSVALSNSFGFGGHNAVLAFRAFES